MSTKVVLPNFTFPGQEPHPAVRALWIAGGTLVIATLILGGAVWHRWSVNAATESAVAKALAKAPESPPAVAEAVRPSAPAQQALAAAPPPAAAAEAPATAAVPAAAPAPARHRVSAHHHRAHATRSVAHGRAVAVRSASDTSGSKKSPAKNDDTIDRLLKQFK